MKFKKINSLRSWQHNKKTPNAQHPLDRHKPLLFRCKREFHIPLTHSKTSQHLPGVPSPRETIWGTEPASHMGKPQRPVGHSHLKPKSSKEKPVNKGSNVQGERISKIKSQSTSYSFDVHVLESSFINSTTKMFCQHEGFFLTSQTLLAVKQTKRQ